MSECPRTLCLYKPGVPLGFPCHYRYTGSVPCTGPLVCMTCGRLFAVPHPQRKLGRVT